MHFLPLEFREESPPLSLNENKNGAVGISQLLNSFLTFSQIFHLWASQLWGPVSHAFRASCSFISAASMVTRSPLHCSAAARLPGNHQL